MKKLLIVTILFSITAGALNASQLPMKKQDPFSQKKAPGLGNLGRTLNSPLKSLENELSKIEKDLKQNILPKQVKRDLERRKKTLSKEIEQMKKEMGKGGLQKAQPNRPMMQTRS